MQLIAKTMQSCQHAPRASAPRMIAHCSQLHCNYARLTRASECGLRRACCTALPQQVQHNHIGITPLLHERQCGIFWDLDNVVPASLSLDLVPAVEELQALLTSCGGKPALVKLYANNNTCARLSQALRQHLDASAIQLQQVLPRNQAADMQLTADAYSFARSYRQQGCLVCVSNDRGFAPILSYISSLGVSSIILASFPSPKALPGLLPHLQQHPLAQVCHAALSWQPAAGAAARRQQQQGMGVQEVQQQQQQEEPSAADRSAQTGQQSQAQVDYCSVSSGGPSNITSSYNISSSSSSASSFACSSSSSSTSSRGGVSGSVRVPLSGSSGWQLLPGMGFLEAVWVNPSKAAAPHVKTFKGPLD